MWTALDAGVSALHDMLRDLITEVMVIRDLFVRMWSSVNANRNT